MPFPPLAAVLALLSLATGALAWMIWRKGKDSLRLGLQERARAKEAGSYRPRLEHPWVDLSRCIGCASCVRACPEQGVLDILHGQAAVVHGSRCIGHGECAAHCPVGAIALTMADRSEELDLPALLPNMEAVGRPGLFLGGEVTGFALIRTAVDHGVRCARGAAERSKAMRQGKDVAGQETAEDVLDLCIVGAGPAGLACALEATRLGLRFVVLEQDRIGGTIARYPRRKLINTHAMELPLGARLESRTYRKQELMELWTRLCHEHALPILEDQALHTIEDQDDGSFQVHTDDGAHHAFSVCLALGRRGIPNRLGVPGEEMMKVHYSLIDARSYTGMNLLVVGGGDSAVEAALGLAEQEGNLVHLSYRRDSFFRLRARNQILIEKAIREKRVQVLWETSVHSIEFERVLLRRSDPDLPLLAVPNDEVFLMVGGQPPVPLLKEAGVSFDPEEAIQAEKPSEQGVGILIPLLVASASAGLLLLWGTTQADYYQATPLQQRGHDQDIWLRSSAGMGLAAGILAAVLICTNLLYLVRRHRNLPLRVGKLSSWMSFHIGTGMLALILAILHSTFSMSNSLGGHTLIGLAVLVATGALGRYLYSFVPRAANGREQALEEAIVSLHVDAKAWTEVHRGFGERTRREIASLIERTRWQHGAAGSILGILRAQRDLNRTLRELGEVGAEEGIDPESLRKVLQVARRAHRDALVAGHFEDLRAMLASWRYLHRWAGLLVVILLIAHVWNSVRFADLGGAG